jgi:hypothetical protein
MATLPNTRSNGQKIKAAWFNEIRTYLSDLAGGILDLIVATDATTTGANATIAASPDFGLRLTNASLTSLAGIAFPTAPKIIVLTNLTGADIVIVNDATATAENRIITGTGEDFDFLNNASIPLYYDDLSDRWRIFGGSGAGGGSNIVSSDLTLTASDTIAIDTGELVQTFRVQGDTEAITLNAAPFGSTPPEDGTIIHLIGNSDTNTVSITATDSADGCVGNFSTITLHKFEVASFMWNTALDRYVLI